MPIYEIELSDGRIIDVESDSEPDHDSVLSALSSYKPSADFRTAQATVPDSLKLTPDLPEPSYAKLMAPPKFEEPFEQRVILGEPDRGPSERIIPGEYMGGGEYKMPLIEQLRDPRAGEEIKPQSGFGQFVEETSQAPVRFGMMRKNEQGKYETELGPTTNVMGEQGMERDRPAFAIPGPVDSLYKYIPEGRLKDVSVGVRNAAAGFANFFLSPQGVALAGVGSAPKATMSLFDAAKVARGGGDVGPMLAALRDPANRAVAAAFAVDMAKHAPDALQAGDDAMRNGDVAGAVEHWVGGASQLALAGLSGKHAITPSRGGGRYASEVSQAAEVHGDVRTQPREGQGQVPIQKDRPGVQSQAEGGLSQPLKMPMEIMTPEEQAAEAQYQRMEREGMEIGTPLSDGERGELKTLSDQFFEGRDMSYDELNHLDLLEARSRAEMQGRVELGEGMIGETERLLTDAVHEEKIGDKVELVDPSKITPDNPLSGRVAQWNPTTGKIEINGRALVQDIQAIPQNRRGQYIRRMVNEESIHSRTTEKQARDFHDNASWIERRLGERIYSGKWGKNLSPEALGYEMVRRRMQHLSRMGATEVAFALGRERWTLKSLDLVDQMIASTREALGTRASKVQTRILGQIERNNNIARKALMAGAVGAQRREVEDLVERLKARTERVSTDEAVDAGLQARSIEDLDDLANGWREWKQDLDAVKARAKTDPSAMMQYAAVAQRGQLYREAIEAATNSGSHKVEARVGREKGLPPPELDYTKNPEVADWLEKNGPELGIKIDQTVGAPRRPDYRNKPETTGDVIRTWDKGFAYVLNLSTKDRFDAVVEGKYLLDYMKDRLFDVENNLAGIEDRLQGRKPSDKEQAELDHHNKNLMAIWTRMHKLEGIVDTMEEQLGGGGAGIGAPRREGQRMEKEDLEAHGVAVEKTAYSVEEKNDLREKLSHDSNIYYNRQKIRDIVNGLPPQDREFIKGTYNDWERYPDVIASAYSDYQDLISRDLHVSSTERKVYDILKKSGHGADLIKMDSMSGVAGTDEARIAALSGALHDEIRSVGLTDYRRPNYPVHPRTVIENWEQYRPEVWRKFPELASLIDEKLYEPKSEIKPGADWESTEPPAVDEAGNPVFPMERRERLSPDQEFKADLDAYYAEHGGAPQIRKSYKGQIPDYGGPDFSLESIGAPRRGMSKKEAERIEALRKYQEAMGQRPATPQGPASGSVSKREAPQSSRKSASEFFAKPTPESIEKIANDVISDPTQVPTFDRFLRHVQAAHGDIKSGQVTELWQQILGKALDTMPADEMERLVDKMGLRRQVFGSIKQGSKALGLTGAPPPIARQGKIAEAAPADIAQTSVAKAQARASKLLERAQILETNAEKARTKEEAAVLSQRAQILRRTADNISAAIQTGEGMPMTQGDLLPGITARTSQLTGQPVPVPGKPGKTKFVGKTPNIPEIQAKGGQVKARDRAKRILFEELTKEAPSLTFGLNRKEITPEDIRWGEEGNEIYAVSKEDLADLDTLGYELTRKAATDATTRKIAGGGTMVVEEAALPRSATKRVVALFDPKTKKVHLVSGYRDGRRGPVFRDPESVTGEHRTLEQLKRYRPLFSIPLDTPVQNFHEVFNSMKAFSDKFYKKIRLDAQRVGWRGLGEEPTIEGTEGLEGEGGMFQGPEAGVQRATEGMTYGILDHMGAEVTGAEARQLFKVFRSFESREDVETYMANLRSKVGGTRENRLLNAQIEDLNQHIERLRDERAGQIGSKEQKLTEKLERLRERKAKLEARRKPQLTNQDWLFLTGLAKAEAGLHDIYRPKKEGVAGERLVKRPTPEEISEETINELHRLSILNATSTSFAKAAQKQLAPRPAPTTPLRSEEAVSPTAREISMRSRVPPTVVRPEQLPPGYKPVSRVAPPPADVVGGGLPVEHPQFNPEREARRVSRAIRYRKLREGEPPVEKKYEPSSYPSTGRAEPENVRYAVRPERKVEIAREVNQIADREVAQEPPKPQQPDLPGTVGAPRRTPGRTLGDKTNNVLNDFGSIYDKWMVDRIYEYGGRVSKQFATMAKGMIDKQKELYGGLTPLLDRARRLAGGIESFDPTIAGSGVKGWVKDLPRRGVESAKAMRAAKWLNGLNKITPKTAVTRAVGALEGTLNVPPWAQKVVQLAQDANLEIGRLLQPVIEGFVATGLWQRNFTGLGYDIIRTGAGDMWKAWTMGMAVANRTEGVSLLTTLRDVRKRFNKMKEVLDDPLSTAEQIEQVNQDMARAYPNVVTHVKQNKMWHEVVHGNLFSYLEQTAQRATHVRSFREQFPNTPDGQRALKTMYRDMKQEMTPEIQRDLDGLLRALNGHPTDEYTGKYSDIVRMGPQQVGGQALRFMNQTVNRVLAQAVLSGQMLTQTPELFFGATPQKMGYKRYLRAVARAGKLYETMELFGSVNRVIHDYTFNPNAAVRSGARILANLTSKAFFTNALNELQEALAATTARITVEDILSGNLSSWDKRMLPETFTDMGFTKREAADMMRGDRTLLDQFQRRAAAALTGGNKAIAESSRMGANRMFNSIFRFQSYPMMKMKQTRDIVTDLHDAWFNHGTPEAKKRSLEKAAYFFGGNIMQGAMLSALTSLMFGGMAGLKIKKNEAKDEPIKFLMESFLASLSGPLYMLWRGRRYGGGPRALAKGFGEQALRAAFPYAVVNDVNDMIDGVGPYRNKSPGGRAMEFVKQKTPGAKLISQGLAMFGLKEKNPEVDQAISAFYRWRRDEMGWKEVNEFGPDDRAEFRMHVGNAVEAAKRGDTDTYINEWLLAVDAKDQQSFRDSIRKKKVLVDKNGAPLSEEWKDKLINRIGLEAFEQLEGFDMMMDVAAEGAIPQP